MSTIDISSITDAISNNGYMYIQQHIYLSHNKVVFLNKFITWTTHHETNTYKLHSKEAWTFLEGGGVIMRKQNQLES